MIEAVEIALYLATVVTAGYAALSLIPSGNPRSTAETAALSILLGCGILPYAMFLAAIAGVKPCRGEIIAFETIAIATIIAARHRRNRRRKESPETPPSREDDKKSPLTGNPGKHENLALAVCVLAMAAGGLVVYLHALAMPVFDIDAYALWGLKAKAIFHEGINSPGFFHDTSLSYSHLNYPLLVPFLASGIFAAIGHMDDSSWRAVFPLIYVGGALFTYASLRWKLAPLPAALLTAAFVTAPSSIRWAGAGTADFTLTLMHAASIFYLVKYIAEKARGDFILAIIFTALAAFTKNEGIPLAALNVAVLAIFLLPLPFAKRKFAVVALFAAAVATIVAPYLIWRSGVPNTHQENYTGRLLQILHKENLERLSEILKLFAMEIFNPRRWGLLWCALPLAAAFNIHAFKKKHVLAMWTILAGHLTLYILVFIISPWPPSFLANMALDRIILHTAPALIYLLALHYAETPLGNR